MIGGRLTRPLSHGGHDPAYPKATPGREGGRGAGWVDRTAQVDRRAVGVVQGEIDRGSGDVPRNLQGRDETAREALDLGRVRARVLLAHHEPVCRLDRQLVCGATVSFDDSESQVGRQQQRGGAQPDRHPTPAPGRRAGGCGEPGGQIDQWFAVVADGDRPDSRVGEQDRGVRPSFGQSGAGHDSTLGRRGRERVLRKCRVLGRGYSERPPESEAASDSTSLATSAAS